MKKFNRVIIFLLMVTGMSFGLKPTSSSNEKVDSCSTVETQIVSIEESKKTSTFNDAVDTFIKNEMTSQHIPGLAVCIIKDGKIFISRNYGYANNESKKSVTDSTTFLIASISKTVTATALMQLYEQNKFNLDDDINKYLPFSVRNPSFSSNAITFKMLLTHTSSLRDNEDIIPFNMNGDFDLPLGQYLKEYLVAGGKYYDAKANFSNRAPGSQLEYCNAAVGLCGYLVEILSGSPFNTYCAEKIFKPLSIQQIGWFLSEMNVDQIAIPYEYENGQLVAYKHYGLPDYPAGQLRVSKLQFAKFLQCIMQGGQMNNVTVLKSATLEMMLTVQNPSIDPNFGLVWFKRKSGNKEVWGHDGGLFGVRTEVIFSKDLHIGVIVFANGGESCTPIADKLFEFAKNTTTIIKKANTQLNPRMHERYSGSKSNLKMIDFSIEKKAWIQVSIFNAQGKRLLTPVKGYFDAGYHTVSFNALLNKGIYFLTFTINGQTMLTQKMTIITSIF